MQDAWPLPEFECLGAANLNIAGIRIAKTKLSLFRSIVLPWHF
jgi:hypothetical protein